MMLEPDVEARPWDEQLAIDERSYREQVAYLLERSAFYRDKLGAAGIASAADAGGLDAIGALPPWDWRPEVVLATALACTLLWVLLDVVARSRSLAAWCVPLADHGEHGTPTR